MNAVYHIFFVTASHMRVLTKKDLTKSILLIIFGAYSFIHLMICYSIKKDGETNEKLILRYKKSFFQTRTANKLRNSQTHSKKPSKRKIREAAIVREFYRSKGQGR